MGVHSPLTITSDSSVLCKQLFLQEYCCAHRLKHRTAASHNRKWFALVESTSETPPILLHKKKRKKPQAKKTQVTTRKPKRIWKSLFCSLLRSKDLCFLFQTILLFTQWITDLTNSINGCSPNSWFKFRSKEDHSHVKYDSPLAK